MKGEIKMKGSPILQSTCLGRLRRRILLPPLAARRPPRAPSPQGFEGGQAFPPMHGVGIGVGASSSQAAAAATPASARAAEQMAYEDAWKASTRTSGRPSPPSRTPSPGASISIFSLRRYDLIATASKAAIDLAEMRSIIWHS
jgi:hypothetical protein